MVQFSHRAFDHLTRLELHDLLRLRGEVFVVEQGISAENDVDGRDPHAVHVLGRDEAGDLVATARLLVLQTPIEVGRIAVRADRRGRGIGNALMHYVHRRLAHRCGVMSAQAHLRAWYERLGWVAEGDVYDEVGIPHVRMVYGGLYFPGESGEP
ncbi:MAG: GNAT family N-acetyltransferase [Planctomycetota bacterium]